MIKISVKNTAMGGTDWTFGEAPIGSTDMNDTFDEIHSITTNISTGHDHDGTDSKTLDFSTGFTSALLPQKIHQAHIRNLYGYTASGVGGAMFEGDGMNDAIIDQAGLAVTTTNLNAFTTTDQGLRRIYYVKAGANITFQTRTLMNRKSNITRANVYFDYDIFNSQDNLTATTDWTEVDSSGTLTVASGELEIVGDTGSESVTYDNIDFGDLTIGDHWILLTKQIRVGAAYAQIKIGAEVINDSGTAATFYRKTDIIATATDAVDVFINGKFSEAVTGISGGDKLTFYVDGGGDDGTLTLYFFAKASTGIATTVVKQIQFDGSTMETISNTLGYKTPANAGKEVVVKMTTSTDADEKILFYGYAVQVE